MKRRYERPSAYIEEFTPNEYVAASTKDAFYDGFVDYNYNGREDKGEAVKVWRGPKQNNGHATTKLNMDTWATAKS